MTASAALQDQAQLDFRHIRCSRFGRRALLLRSIDDGPGDRFDPNEVVLGSDSLQILGDAKDFALLLVENHSVEIVDSSFTEMVRPSSAPRPLSPARRRRARGYQCRVGAASSSSVYGSTALFSRLYFSGDSAKHRASRSCRRRTTLLSRHTGEGRYLWLR